MIKFKAFFLLNLLPFYLIIISEAAPYYLHHFCPRTSTYTPNSIYDVNLNTLLTNLSSYTISHNNMFYNASIGENPAHKAYGSFTCRGDVTNITCHDCVVTAVQDIIQRCPNRKEGVIWYDECTLRYDDKSFYSVMDTTPIMSGVSLESVTESDRFARVVRDLMNDLANRASNDKFSDGVEHLKGFATGKTNFTSFRTLYSLVQCTPDLSGTDCKSCLLVAINELSSCCIRKEGGRVFVPSCNIRFSTKRFFGFLPSPTSSSSMSPEGIWGISKQVIIGIIISVFVSTYIITSVIFFLRKRRANKYNRVNKIIDGSEMSEGESLQYDLITIEAATNNFSIENKLGQGGFGGVFKGKLPNGQEIAVKRLSRSSGQGALEFKNEVLVVAKLQHRNLVRLVGFCLEGEEKILIYEFVLNKSLDYFLFDPEKQQLLNWSRRYKIIREIAQGVLYLHEHSRLRIIHRDLKASNVLLDGDMNPKISDFGMARIFGVDQSQGNTSRIVGTFGYMAPEYAMHGKFSVKSDVFSFGVLILEIISGKKNNTFYQSGAEEEDLLSYAWKRWRNDTPLDLVDPSLGDLFVRNEIIRCIHIGLLCVQEDANERPTMSHVVLMLSSDTVTLPLPHQPAFFFHNRKEALLNQLELEGKPLLSSTNELTITELYPR